MKKKILICGGGGFIGHHLARKLHKQGHRVIVVDIKPQNEYANRDDFCDVYLQGDLTTEWVWNELDDIYHGFEDLPEQRHG